jgi:formylglycine-generating enzyme required for sulfatase activity/tRNA A-37 threonylcarbamoyl transferase component Bud32
MDLTGVTIGQYQVVEEIGQGGMATVYKARQSSLDRYVAIKILKSDLAKTKGFVTRFEREARTIARLRHRNILTIFDYGHEDDLFYLVMEYVGGGTLKQRLGWPQDMNYAVNIVSQVGNALAHAHKQGMIHRDVKPGNILMVEEDWPLLSDFGLAKMVQDSLRLTLSGASVGTPQYMSPEQAQSLPVDQRSDIYSLGVVLYEAVTGQPPFGIDSPMAIILKHISDPVTPPHNFRSDLPEDIERVILKSLAKDMAKRYQKMEDFLDELHEAANFNGSHRNHVPVESNGPPMIFEPIPVTSVTPRPAPKRTFPFIRSVIRIAVLVALILTLLLFKDSTASIVSALTNAIATVSTGLLATASPPLAGMSNPLATPSGPAAKPSPTVAITSPTATAATSLPSELTPPTPESSPTPTPSPSPAATTTPTPSLPQIEVRVWETDNAEMVFVPAGEFAMGSDELGDDEQPIHRVYLDDFWIDRYEVTNERFARFVAEADYQTDAEKANWGWVRVGSEWEAVSGADWRHPRGPSSGIEDKMDHPVVLVSWNDADTYCRWSGKRLPTEAQWEKAARGPTLDSGYIYAWGEEFDPSKANTKESNLNDTIPVGSFSPQGDSPYGASDMTGNVWEWVTDWYDSSYYTQAPPSNPPGPAAGTYKVLRGGSWLFDELYARTAFRYSLRPDYTYDFTGFRCSSQ